MRILKLAVSAALAASLIGLDATVALPAQAAQSGAVASVNAGDARARILADVNAARVSAGLRPLVGDAAIDQVAQGCSLTQAGAEKMAHCTGFQTKYPSGWTWAGENVAYGLAVESVVAAWLASPGHRANILRPEATHLGVGMATSSTGTRYYTQNFAAYPAVARQGATLVRTSYDGKIWSLDGGAPRALSYGEWRNLGFPAWRPAQTDYVRYPWSNAIVAVTRFDSSAEVTVHLNSAMWNAAGRPTPRAVGWIGGSRIYQWAGSAELFLQDPSGAVRKLSYPEWRGTGFRGFERRANQGYVSLSWSTSGAIAYMCDVAAGKGGRVGYAEWVAAGAPTPARVSRTQGDAVFWGSDGSGPRAIRYAGAAEDVQLSFSQWQSLGAPTPAALSAYDAAGRSCG